MFLSFMNTSKHIFCFVLTAMLIVTGAVSGLADNASTVSTMGKQCAVQAYFSPYDNIESLVVNRLSDAKETVNCSLYGITNRAITDSLIKLVKDGKNVTLCLDKMQSAGKSSAHHTLRKAGVDIVIKKINVLEHNKFCVIDDERVLMGSWNYSGNAQAQDNSLIDLSGCDDVVKQFKEAFTRIYERDQNIGGVNKK